MDMEIFMETKFMKLNGEKMAGIIVAVNKTFGVKNVRYKITISIIPDKKHKRFGEIDFLSIIPDNVVDLEELHRFCLHFSLGNIVTRIEDRVEFLFD